MVRIQSSLDFERHITIASCSKPLLVAGIPVACDEERGHVRDGSMKAKAVVDCAIHDGQASGQPWRAVAGLTGFLGRL
jgi:hypothetical protein